MIRTVASVLYLFLNISFGICAPIPTITDPALLVISYDAFRPEYLHRKVTPNLNKLAKEGTSAPYMLNVFPTKTFVNHFTIATGIYAETHGVLANELYDSKLGKLGYGYDLFHYNNDIEPIWTANEKNGRNSGCMMWPGSNFDYKGINCTFVGNFDGNMKWEQRVDIALSWFTHKRTPANFVMLYIEEPDAHGHIYGPESPVITNMVARLDNLTQYIQEKLIDTGLNNRLNVIHLSDHGMKGVAPPKFIYLDEILSGDNCDFYGSSPLLQIVPKDPKKENEIFEKLTKAAKENGHFKVYNQNNFPSRWHANCTRRLGPILAVADIDYGFQDLMENAKYYAKKYNIPITNETQYGVHGYDNAEPTMHPIFLAKGPLFAKGKTIAPVNMIDLYNLFCFILNIKCGQNHGTKQLEKYDDLFAVKPDRTAHKDDKYIWCVIFVLFLVVVVVITKVKQLRKQYAFLRYQERSKHLLSDFENTEEPLIN